MAGLSDRKVITAPRAATPGRLKSGFISGRSSFSSSVTTPNSAISLLRAPVSTVIPMRYSTTLRIRLWAVFIIVLRRFPLPIFHARRPNPPQRMVRKIRASMIAFLFLVMLAKCCKKRVQI